MKKTLYTLAILCTLSALCASCSTSKGSAYQNHLKSKRTGHTHITTTNRGCGWANN